MKFSQQAAANVVPFLARVLLFLAFVPAGWHHAMQFTDFSGTHAGRLRDLGIVSAAAPSDITHVAWQQDAPPLPPEALEALGVQTRSLHELTLVFDGLRLPRPEVWAWTVTVFELVGGSLLLVGLFSRVWAAGLSLWSLALLYLSTPSISDTFFALWTPTDPNALLPRALALSLLAIFVIALGVMLTGPGKFSLDGLIFRRDAGNDHDDE